MPGAHSTDLRDRVLVAVEAGEPADAVAEAFMVGRSSVYRWLAAVRDEGRRTPKPMGGGPKPIIRDAIEAVLCRLLAANNHLTLTECRDQLAAETGETDGLAWAKLHRDLITRFGRFPHRNAVLGRLSTPQEVAYLAQGGFAA